METEITLTVPIREVTEKLDHLAVTHGMYLSVDDAWCIINHAAMLNGIAHLYSAEGRQLIGSVIDGHLSRWIGTSDRDVLFTMYLVSTVDTILDQLRNALSIISEVPNQLTYIKHTKNRLLLKVEMPRSRLELH